MIDTHAHLASLDDPDAVVERAAEAGVTRILTVGTDSEDWRAQPLRSPTRTRASSRSSGSIRTRRARRPTATSTRSATLLAHPKVVAVGETGLDWFRDYAPTDAQKRLFAQQLELAAELGKPVVIHTRAADEDTLAALAGHTGTVVLHCFSSPRMLPTALERGWYVSFAGNVSFPKAVDLRLAATQVPADRILAETDSPYLAPQPRARPPERAGVRRPHARGARAGARGGSGRARGADRRERKRMLRPVKAT